MKNIAFLLGLSAVLSIHFIVVAHQLTPRHDATLNLFLQSFLNFHFPETFTQRHFGKRIKESCCLLSLPLL